jgi:hypothetical protein
MVSLSFSQFLSRKILSANIQAQPIVGTYRIDFLANVLQFWKRQKKQKMQHILQYSSVKIHS